MTRFNPNVVEDRIPAEILEAADVLLGGRSNAQSVERANDLLVKMLARDVQRGYHAPPEPPTYDATWHGRRVMDRLLVAVQQGRGSKEERQMALDYAAWRAAYWKLETVGEATVMMLLHAAERARKRAMPEEAEVLERFLLEAWTMNVPAPSDYDKRKRAVLRAVRRAIARRAKDRATANLLVEESVEQAEQEQPASGSNPYVDEWNDVGYDVDKETF